MKKNLWIWFSAIVAFILLIDSSWGLRVGNETYRLLPDLGLVGVPIKHFMMLGFSIFGIHWWTNTHPNNPHGNLRSKALIWANNKTRSAINWTLILLFIILISQMAKLITSGFRSIDIRIYGVYIQGFGLVFGLMRLITWASLTHLTINTLLNTHLYRNRKTEGWRKNHQETT